MNHSPIHLNQMIEDLKVIWYNTEVSQYQSGNWNDYQELKSACLDPDKLLIVERFHREPAFIITKIVSELNKIKSKARVHS